jgi:putative zinc finger/helix-turn-helix YgiT family protein
MNCPVCNSKAVCTKEIYHYTECGLNNVLLEGVDVCNCSCGEEFVSIPAMPELHSLIGTNLIKKKALLDSQEIRFLRKNVGLTAKKLSLYLGVDNATISRWENGKQEITKSHDHLVRLVYSTIKGIPADEIKHLIEEEFEEIKPKKMEIPEFKISFPWSQSVDNCVIA